MQNKTSPKTIPAGEFKAHCLKLMDEVCQKRNHLLITKRGKPIAQLIPWEGPKKSLFGWMKGSVVEHGDIVGPLAINWEADADEE